MAQSWWRLGEALGRFSGNLLRLHEYPDGGPCGKVRKRD